MESIEVLYGMERHAWHHMGKQDFRDFLSCRTWYDRTTGRPADTSPAQTRKVRKPSFGAQGGSAGTKIQVVLPRR